jgi:hypothetical protein
MEVIIVRTEVYRKDWYIPPFVQTPRCVKPLAAGQICFGGIVGLGNVQALGIEGTVFGVGDDLELQNIIARLHFFVWK